MKRPLKPQPRMSEAERADERRFIVKLLAATVAVQLVGGALAIGLVLRTHHPVVAGAPPPPTLPAATQERRGAIDVGSR